jgi:hypothetical protein
MRAEEIESILKQMRRHCFIAIGFLLCVALWVAWIAIT